MIMEQLQPIAEHLFESIKQHEGRVVNEIGEHVPYRCSSNRLTIGYGHNLDEHGIDEETANYLLHEDVAGVLTDLINADKMDLMDEIGMPRSNVLVEMGFNMGVPNLLKFKRMWGALAIHDYARASDEMLDSKWANQVGERAITLAHQMKTGQLRQIGGHS